MVTDYHVARLNDHDPPSVRLCGWHTVDDTWSEKLKDDRSKLDENRGVGITPRPTLMNGQGAYMSDEKDTH